MKIYAIYKGDKFIDEGTVKELAKRQGAKEETIRFMTAGVTERRNKGNRKITFVVEDLEVK